MPDSVTMTTPAVEPLPAGFARRRMSGDERRQHLIDAALHLFATNGFRGTTTKAIAQAAGVSEGIIFRYFPRKEDLYTAILNHKARQQGSIARWTCFDARWPPRTTKPSCCSWH
jgi:AcrR family transcriptional regulator